MICRFGSLFTRLFAMPFIAIIFLFSSPGAVSHPQTSVRGPDGTQLRINLSLNKRKFKLGEPIELSFEIENVGTVPLLIGNGTSLVGNHGPRLDLELKDGKGNTLSGMKLIGDSFGIAPNHLSLPGLMSRWLLLCLRCSHVQRFHMDLGLFGFRGKSGIYHLSGAYISPSFSETSSYRQLGLTEDDMKSIPFPSWSGTFSIEPISFKITAE
ncbi:MAG: hypothetical protein JST77_01145 [Acidobacteria bacterium]|nr:hypothetical protein [Acidobacteriota bacterium]